MGDLLSEIEALQEELTATQLALAEERAGRTSAEDLARSLVKLSTPASREELAHLIVDLMRKILGAEAVILEGKRPLVLRAVTATREELMDFFLPWNDFVERILLERSVHVARTDLHPHWREQLDCLPLAGSALHIGISSGEQGVMLVCVHSERGYFSRELRERVDLIQASLRQAWDRTAATEREAALRRQAELANRRLREAQEESLAARDTAEQASLAKSVFLAQMSHELRTPLSGIIGLTELALASDQEEEAREMVDSAHTCAEHLLLVLNDILDLSKIEAGKLTLERIPINLPELVDETCLLGRVRAKEKRLELKVELGLGESPCWRLGDPLRLKQVLFNLLSNAVKFTEEGGVTIRVRAEGKDMVRFDVEDTGIGIPQDRIKTIFDAFRQVDETTSRRFGGTGLGLTICRKLVSMFGGEIWAESEAGKGARFSFTAMLPGTAPQQVSANGSQEEDLVVGKLRVLVADDNVVNRMIACKFLKRLGHETGAVEDGIEAVEALRRDSYDLVLMDLQMPRMDGLTATAEIRKLDIPYVPIVALTANAMAGERERCLAAGMDAYLTKPLRAVNLITTLKTISSLLPS